ncbi:MAG: hypothetical protein ABIJ12_02260 [bacterium]
MFKKLLIAILLLFIIFIAGLYFGRNYIVKSAIETGSEYSLGVNTNVGSVNLDLSGKSLEISDYEVNNPEGYEGDFFLNIEQGIIAVGEGSIFANETRVDSLILDGINMSFEVKNQKGNFSVIQNNIKNINFDSSPDSEHKFFIKKLAIRNIKVNAALDFLGQNSGTTFTVDNISMENIGGDEGVTISEITTRIMKSLISKAKSSGSDDISEMFNLDAGKLDELKSDVTDKVKDLGESILKK